MNEPSSLDKPRFVPAHYSDAEFASIELTHETISRFLHWAANVPVSHREMIRRKIADVANDDSLVMALCEELLRLDGVDPVRHFMLLSTLGETRNAVAVPALEKLIWHEGKTERHEGSTPGCADVSTTELLAGLQARDLLLAVTPVQDLHPVALRDDFEVREGLQRRIVVAQ